MLSVPNLGCLAVTGVYFLYREGIVVYVGQAVDVRKRVATHLGEGVKLFDAVSFIACAAGDLLRVEREFIKALKPEYNRTHVVLAGLTSDIQFRGQTPVTKLFLSHAEAAAYLGLSGEEFLAARERGDVRRCRERRGRPPRHYHLADIHAHGARLHSQGALLADA